MKQYVTNVEPALIKEVDKIVKKKQHYSSRNEFIRDAIRSKVKEPRAMKLREALRKIRETALKRGWNGEMPTKAEREKILQEFLKEKGLSLD
ncbi:MAG: ribbon-helix-helix protein, CopG family [Candidatus Diapherotrites archaeon]|uniref:Ribbon-helix-helix protein, CopG family n=1 Tax=Candidatus Iainarchaeum sp. TaxID=3101447 RepID=A0A8T4LAG2_9ARCH|nr:ribbon-helix-helix protein, CopG family [Candidatus Diapherotrites archaeon]